MRDRKIKSNFNKFCFVLLLVFTNYCNFFALLQIVKNQLDFFLYYPRGVGVFYKCTYIIEHQDLQIPIWIIDYGCMYKVAVLVMYFFKEIYNCFHWENYRYTCTTLRVSIKYLDNINLYILPLELWEIQKDFIFIIYKRDC